MDASHSVTMLSWRPHLAARSSASGWKVWTSRRESIGTTSTRKTSTPRVVPCGSEFCGASWKAIAMAMAFFGENLGGQLWIDQIWWLVIIIFQDFRRDTPIYCYDVLSTNDEYCKTNGCERNLHWVTLMNIRILLAEKSHSHRHLIEHNLTA